MQMVKCSGYETWLRTVKDDDDDDDDDHDDKV
jgi:hypothetical protein